MIGDSFGDSYDVGMATIVRNVTMGWQQLCWHVDWCYVGPFPQQLKAFAMTLKRTLDWLVEVVM